MVAQHKGLHARGVQPLGHGMVIMDDGCGCG